MAKVTLSVRSTLLLASLLGPAAALSPARTPQLPLLALRGGSRPAAPTPAAHQVFRNIEDEGARRCAEPSDKLFWKSIVAGACVGLGGTLCAGIGGDIGDVPFWAPGQGLKRFAFGAIGFPLSIALVALTGSSAWTGNLPMVGAALRAGKADLASAARLLGINYAGCFVGTVLLGMLTAFAALPAAMPTIGISLHKLELTGLQTLLRGVGGGALISLAITLANCAVQSGGSVADVVVAVFLPIMTYVACDFEHVLANFYFFASAICAGGELALAPVLRNLLFSTAGNLIGAWALGGYFLTWANGPVAAEPEKRVEAAAAPGGGA